MPRRAWKGAITLGALALSLTIPARADGPLGPEGSPISTSSYAIDLFQGPVLASSRITGLGGAYAPLGEGADGFSFNAASPALRPSWSTDRTDWDLTGGVIFPASVSGTDFDNNGTRGFAYNNFVFATVGGLIQHEAWGIGTSVNVQQYDLGKPADGSDITNLRVRMVTSHVLTGYSFYREELSVGAGVRIAALGVVDATSLASERALFNMAGAAPEVGTLYAPRDAPIRIGATGRFPVRTTTNLGGSAAADARGDRAIGGLVLPEEVVWPWELEIGLAAQLGARKLNVVRRDTRDVDKARINRERRKIDGQYESDTAVARRILKRSYLLRPRRHVLLVASALLTGRSPDAIGFESFLSQRVERSGERLALSPRVGAEYEVVPHFLIVRAGSYIEPTRFRGSAPRLHGATGLHFKALTWSMFGLFSDDTAFKLGGVIDVARDYFGWGLSAGIWH